MRELLDDSWRTAAWQRSMDSERMSQIDCGWELLAGNQELIKAMGGRSVSITPVFLGPAQRMLRPVILGDVLMMMDFDERATEAVLAANWPTARRKLRSDDPPEQWNAVLHPVARMLTPSLDRAALRRFQEMTDRRLVATAL